MVNPKDEELLEKAASAANYKIWWKDGVCKGGPFKSCFIGDAPWNPLEDSKEAMRLAVEKEVFTKHHSCYVAFFEADSNKGTNPMDAARRAIVQTVALTSTAHL